MAEQASAPIEPAEAEARLEFAPRAGEPFTTAAEPSARAMLIGELHNRPDLRRELGADAEASDADLLLAAYLRRGPGFVDRVRGVFACGVWDRRDRSLVLARDPLGIVPLFYAEADSRLYVSTSPDELVALPGVSSALNAAALADHLAHRWPDNTETLFAAVRRVPPGHALVVQGATRRLYRYWNPIPPGGTPSWVKPDELDRFDTLLEDAVSRGLAHGRAGIFLSGGLDSVSVAAVATDTSSARGLRPPIALSLAFPGEADEEAVQRSVSEQLGLPQVLLPLREAVGPRGVLGAAVDASAELPAPLANIWYPAYARLAGEASEQGCGVIFSGAGGDEWLTVTPFLAADLLRSGNASGLIRLWKANMRSFNLGRAESLRSLLWEFGLRPLLGAATARHLPRAFAAYRGRRAKDTLPEWLAPDPILRRQLLDRAIAAEPPLAPRGFYLRQCELSLNHALVSMEMEELYANARRTGLQTVMPFWDAGVVDFLYRTPPDLLNEGGRSKSLVRNVLARRFPELGFGRHKKVLAANFFLSTMLAEGPAVWRTMEGPFALAATGVIEEASLNSYVQEVFQRGWVAEIPRLWTIMSLEAWVRARVPLRGR